jgi:hypothetical protein
MLEVPTEPGPQSSRENRTGAVVCALPYPAGFYNELTPLMHDIRRDGLDL